MTKTKAEVCLLTQRNRILRRTTLVLSCLLFLSVYQTAGSCTDNNRLTLDWNVPVTAPSGGHLGWYEMKADPEDTNNLIICGAKWRSQENAYYGVVYVSRDGGRIWKEALEDHNSTWVSEQSCAFGVRHTAYFISEASKVIDGVPHHDLGTTRVFTSSNAGETWVETAKTGWADYSSSVVGKPPGSAARQLYVSYNSRSKFDEAKKLGGTLDFFTVSEDGTKMSERQTVPGMADRNYAGVYPSSTIELKDGAPIVLFEAFPKSVFGGGGPRSYEIAVVRFGRDGPTRPSIIATPAVKQQSPTCPASLSNSIAYDRARDALYVAYNDVVSDRCAIMLTNSHDGGLTWSAPRELRSGTEPQVSMYSPLLTVNPDGVIGLLWRGKPRNSNECWYFSVSRDGLALNQTVMLSPCVQDNSFNSQSSAYLASVIQKPTIGQPVDIRLLTFRDYLVRSGLTDTGDSCFHPLWSTSGEGNGELRTARVCVGEPVPSVPRQLLDVSKLVEVTDKVTVLYAGEQRLDRETGSLTLEVSFRNDGSTPLRSPIYLKVESISSDFGDIELVKPTSVVSLSGDYLDLTSVMRGGSLKPGETSSGYRLTFHLRTQKAAARQSIILETKLRLFVGP